MRQLAYCNECKKTRRIKVEVVMVGYFDPKERDITITGFGDIIIRCATCYYGIKGLSQAEMKELYAAAADCEYS